MASQVLYADFASGALTDMTANWTAAGSVCRSVASSAASSGAGCSPPPSAQSRAVFAGASALCSGWVRSVAYEVRHSSSAQGTIDQVRAGPGPGPDVHLQTSIEIIQSGELFKYKSIRRFMSVCLHG